MRPADEVVQRDAAARRLGEGARAQPGVRLGGVDLGQHVGEHARVGDARDGGDRRDVEVAAVELGLGDAAQDRCA